MSEGKEVIQLKLENGEDFFIEVEKKSSGIKRTTGGVPIPDVDKVGTTFEQALDRQVIPVAQAALGRIQQGLSVNEVELKFGVKVTAETGAIIASVGGEVNFEITLKWKRT
jgi:hypothetical protein